MDPQIPTENLPPPPEEAQVKTRSGQYRLLSKVAQGGMAEVYLAKTVDPAGIERRVVIKRILPHISLQPEYIEMLIDEAKIAVHFTHGNIAQVYDLGRVGEDYFIVMEYVDGKTLSQINRALLERHQRWPLDVLLYCLIELCHGLSYIHRKTGPSGRPLGVIHRDVSPQNIILSYAGNVKIIDFGVAKADILESKTDHGVLKGKFAYMSPEQASGEKIDHRSDIFSIGTLMWELVTGERLFKRASNQETIRAVQKAKVELPSDRRVDIPKAYDKIVKKALQRNPRHRYADASDVALDLEKLLLAVNPEFRPLTAAKFLFDLFGPEPDEKDLPPPFFVSSPAKKEAAMAIELPKSPPVLPLDDEPPTEKEFVGVVETTPVVKVPLSRRIPYFYRVAIVAAVLLFGVGGVYAYIVHEMNRFATLKVEGFTSDMTLTLNGEKKQSGPGGVFKIFSRQNYQLRVSQSGYKDFVWAFRLKPRENAVVRVELEKDIPPYGDVLVTTHPAGAKVYLDGVLQESTTPITLSHLDKDRTYHLRFVLPDHAEVEKDVVVEGGKVLQVDQTLELMTGTMILSSSPAGARVVFNGVDIGVTPLRIQKILPGAEHQIEITKEGYETERFPLTMTASEMENFSLELVPILVTDIAPDTVEIDETGTL